MNPKDAITRAMRARYSVGTELAIVGLVILVWQAVRIPLEGNVEESLAHADTIVNLQSSLGLHVESWVVDAVSGTSAAAVLTWLYENVHLPILFGFVAAARLLRPGQYPLLRTTFILSFVPAVLVIGLYPLAPPHWLPELGFGGPPTDHELVAGGALFHNSTAAAASQHFGFAAFVAGASIWLFPRSVFAWSTIAYPALVFVVIVGTGNHYVFDCVVGTLTFVGAALVARRLHENPLPKLAPVPGAIGMAVGYALCVWAFVSLEITNATWERDLPYALVLAIGIACVLAPRLTAKEPALESN